MMRRLISVTILLLLMGTVFSQSWVASTRLSSPNDITYIQSQTDQDQNVYVFGSFSDVISVGSSIEAISNGGNDYFLCKFNLNGEPIWIKAIGGHGDEDQYGGMTINNNGEIVVAGGFSDTILSTTEDTIVCLGLIDIFLSKFTIDGDELWLKSVVTGRDIQRATHLSIDIDDNLILTGQFRDSTFFEDVIAPAKNNSSLHGFYSKLSSQDGSSTWWKTIESLDSKDGILITKASSSESQIVIIGSFSDSIVIENDTIVSQNTSKDAFIINTELNGNLNWLNIISGTSDELAQSLLIDKDNLIYVSGQYSSPFLKTNITTPDSLIDATNMGGFDLFMTKYSESGQLEWLITTGGKGDDGISESELLEDFIIVSGNFSDTLLWGDSIVNTSQEADKDLFLGYMDFSGNLYHIKVLSGYLNSREESEATHHSASDNGYSLISSNSPLLRLGDDVLTSPHNNFHLTLGKLGCKTPSIDYVQANNVETCSGDSTGSIQFFISGGFGAPYKYSIDGGEKFNYSESLVSNLPKGIYSTAVMDREMCMQTGPTKQIFEPDPLEIEVISSTNITLESDGLIVVGAMGGTSPYTYTLLPDGDPQGYGTYIFSPGEQGAYVVEMNDGNSCGPVRTDTITISFFTGIIDAETAALRVFPNPATDMVTIEMPMEAAEVSMEVLSLTGQVVLSRQAYTAGGVLRETLDVSDLADGMYMLRLNGETLKSAIVVN